MFLWSHRIDDTADGVMIYEHECSVSENLRQGLDLLVPVKHGSLLCFTLAHVVDRTGAHEQSDYEAQDGGDNLQDLRVLNVTKTEVDRQKAEDSNANEVRVEASEFVLEGFFTVPKGVRDTHIKAFGAADIFKADGAVHVQDENEDDGVSEP